MGRCSAGGATTWGSSAPATTRPAILACRWRAAPSRPPAGAAPPRPPPPCAIAPPTRPAAAAASPSGPATVSGGFYHTCALMRDGTAQCWGKNTDGQLGNGTTKGSNTPVPVTGISNAAAVVAGWFHSCALMPDGTVQCWGNNSFGQLGNGTTT